MPHKQFTSTYHSDLLHDLAQFIAQDNQKQCIRVTASPLFLDFLLLFGLIVQFVILFLFLLWPDIALSFMKPPKYAPKK